MIRTEVNCTTGEVIEIEMTPEEIAQFEAAQAESQRFMDELNRKEEERKIAKASAEAKLAALGLTAEEIAAL